jgi:hypothetical protein
VSNMYGGSELPHKFTDHIELQLHQTQPLVVTQITNGRRKGRGKREREK